MFFIAGITGNVGGATARCLLDQGHAVRALARDPQKAAAWSDRGVDVRQGDLADAAALTAALQGVEGAFLMIPPTLVPSHGYPEARAVIASYLQALLQSPPPRLALLSSMGSQQTHGLGNITATHLMERALAGLLFPTAFIRAGSFLENYAFGLDRAAATGFFDTFFTPADRAVPMIATADIGDQIAALLSGGWSGRKIIELGTYRSSDELAAAMTEVLGVPVQARPVPRAHWPEALQAMGLPPGQTGLYEEMMDGVNSGWINFGEPGTEVVAGTVTPADLFARVRQANTAP